VVSWYHICSDAAWLYVPVCNNWLVLQEDHRLGAIDNARHWILLEMPEAVFSGQWETRNIEYGGNPPNK